MLTTRARCADRIIAAGEPGPGAQKSVAIVTSDVTRAVPNHELLPPVLDDLTQAGSPKTVTVVFGGGAHRPVTRTR